MIKEFVERFMGAKPRLERIFATAHPEDYMAVVRAVISVLRSDADLRTPDVERIHEIDDGDWQGTLVYVIAAEGYQPSTYWYVKVSYGSCSGCDTLEGIRGYSGDAPTDEQVSQYMTLALHIVQGLKRMGYEDV